MVLETDDETYRNSEWLCDRVDDGWSVDDIAEECNASIGNVLFYLQHFGIVPEGEGKAEEAPNSLGLDKYIVNGAGNQGTQYVPVSERGTDYEYEDEEWLREAFIEEKRGIYEVSQEYNVPMSDLYDAARKYGVFNVHRKRRLNDEMKYRYRHWLLNQLKQGRNRKELAEEFDVHPATIGFHQKKLEDGWVL